MVDKLLLHAKEQNKLKGTHLYLPTHPLLSSVIAHYTVCAGGAVDRQVVTLVPDASGCLVFSLWPSREQHAFWGPTTATVVVGQPEDPPILRVFVEFLPGGAAQIFSRSMQELKDLRIPVGEFEPKLKSSFSSVVFRSDTLEKLKENLDFLFLSLLYSQKDQRGEAVRLIHLIEKGKGTLRMSQLCAQSFYSERQINRLLACALGMSLKQYSRVLRINRTLGKIGEEGTLAQLAVEMGYYDQAHFAHDFKTVCGVSPTRYREELTAFYHEARKFS